MSLFGSYNRVTLMGRMTRDVEVKTLPSGTTVGEMSLAVSDRQKKGDQWEEVSHFFDCVGYGKSAEWLQRFGGKGKLILVEGQLRQDRWEDKSSGQKRSKVRILIDNITFVDSGNGEGSPRGNQSRGGGRSDYEGGYGGKPKSSAQPYRSNFDDVPDSGNDGDAWEPSSDGNDAPSDGNDVPWGSPGGDWGSTGFSGEGKRPSHSKPNASGRWGG